MIPDALASPYLNKTKVLGTVYNSYVSCGYAAVHMNHEISNAYHENVLFLQFPMQVVVPLLLK